MSSFQKTMYEPAEDSIMLKKELIVLCSQKRVRRILDMGTGSGILAIAALSFAEEVVAVDIDEESLEHLKKEWDKGEFIGRRKLTIIKSDLFTGVPANLMNSFDIIVFNPPYLPKGVDDFDDSTLYGGEKGYELTIRFLSEAKDFLSKDGVMLFVASSLAGLEAIEAHMKSLGYSFSLLDKEHFFFEDVVVYKAWREQD